MEPYYLLMRLPNEQSETFLILQPFVPVSQSDQRKNLSAFMIAKSDPGDFGHLEVFEMPREETVPGPTQVDAKINQDVDISQQLTLLGQRGSTVRAGNLLLIPIQQSLLYIRPLYVEAEDTQLPELKRVVVVYGKKVVAAETLRDALAAIFGAAPPTQESGGGTTPPVGGGGTVSPTVQSLLDQALAAFQKADDALKAGDLAEFQRQITLGRQLTAQARQAAGSGSGGSGGSGPTTTTTTAPASA